MRARIVTLATLFVSLQAFAEKSNFNIHLNPMVGVGLDKREMVSGAALKVDTTLIKALGPLAPQIELFGLGAQNARYLNQGASFGAGLGLRLRLFNDEQGFFFNPGTNHTGNLWGNYWFDGHFTLTDEEKLSPGFSASTGAEFSLVEGLSVGPFVRFQYTLPHQLLLFGISFTIGAPQTTPADTDFDHDGIKGDDDKCGDEPEDMDGIDDKDGCPDLDDDKDGIFEPKDKCPKVAEDKDSFEDDDGCPDLDNDKDGVNDTDDKCPAVAGAKDNAGCPDNDKDADGTPDRLDKCIDVAGLKENAGCPDKDTDGDTIVDRLDKCPDVKGLAETEGCPLPDEDKDGVADRFDNCPKEAGPETNQGCPEKVKQLVVITKEKIVIKEKVFFDSGKSTIQKRSNPLLDQIATVLVAHTELKKVQIEGHTDNAGKADKNKKLSQERAEAVKTYLVKKGVGAERLTAVGFGQEKPADTNTTPAGRENNRRVEFNILDM